MNREDFIKNFWQYYLYLEQDFISLTRYIECISQNNNTVSDEIHKQILSVGMEFENINKQISKKPKGNIKTFREYWKEKYPNINNIEIKILFSKENCILKPFKDIKTLCWWKRYNAIKHNRYKNYNKVTFWHLLNVLSALFFCEMYFVKIIGDETHSLDVPNTYSLLFEIIDWKTKHKLVPHKDLCFANKEDIEGLFTPRS